VGRRILNVAMSVILTVFMLGCTHSITGSLELAAGDEAQLVMLGSRVQMKLKNDGPGDVRVEVVGDSHELKWNHNLEAGELVHRVLLHRMQARILNTSQRTTMIWFDIRAGEGARITKNGKPIDPAKYEDQIESLPDM